MLNTNEIHAILRGLIYSLKLIACDVIAHETSKTTINDYT